MTYVNAFVCPSVSLLVLARLPLDKFPSNLILWTFIKIRRRLTNLVLNGQKFRALEAKTQVRIVVAGENKSLQKCYGISRGGM
jgi:hypothetical protein